MDIMGLSKRMFHQLGQLTAPEQVAKSQPIENNTAHSGQGISPLSERLDKLAREFDVKSMPVSELVNLQESLRDSGFIQENQVRAQGLLPQLAYHHYQAGPMDIEAALEEHLGRLKDQPAVLADYQEGNHVLNVVRNLASARQQQTQAA
jgi:hypothetical protein